MSYWELGIIGYSEREIMGDSSEAKLNDEKLNEAKQKILDGIYSQISSFDNKANILISVIGIFFAISLNFLSIFQETSFKNATESERNWYTVLFFLFCVFSVFTIFSFIMVIVPRGNRKKAQNDPNYYKAVAKMSEEEIEKRISQESGDYLIHQIKINAKICNKKHIWLMAGIIGLIPFAVTFFGLIGMNCWGF